MIAARAAAAFGPAVIDGYGKMLANAQHPVGGLDAILGLASIGVCHEAARRATIDVIQNERERLNRRPVIAPEFFALGFARALRLLESAGSGEPPGGPNGPSFRVDPFQADAAGSYPALETLPAALDLPAWKYIPALSAGRGETTPSPAEAFGMFVRAWIGGNEPTPTLVRVQ